MSAYETLKASLENAKDGDVAVIGNGFGIGVQTSEGYFGGEVKELVLVVADRKNQWTIPYGDDGENLSYPIALSGETSLEDAIDNILADYSVISENKRMLARRLQKAA